MRKTRRRSRIPVRSAGQTSCSPILLQCALVFCCLAAAWLGAARGALWLPKARETAAALLYAPLELPAFAQELLARLPEKKEEPAPVSEPPALLGSSLSIPAAMLPEGNAGVQPPGTTPALPQPLGEEPAAAQSGLALTAGEMPQLEGSLTPLSLRGEAQAFYVPAQGRVTSGFGRRRHPVTGRWDEHTGIDLGAPEGSGVYAFLPGVVAETGYDAVYGNFVELMHSPLLASRYCHCRSLLVKEGETVGGGELIASVGDTGLSTGPHLHFELRLAGEPFDPATLVSAAVPAPAASAL